MPLAPLRLSLLLLGLALEAASLSPSLWLDLRGRAAAGGGGPQAALLELFEAVSARLPPDARACPLLQPLHAHLRLVSRVTAAAPSEPLLLGVLSLGADFATQQLVVAIDGKPRFEPLPAGPGRCAAGPAPRRGW